MAENRKKVWIVETHPIQYKAPLFKMLAQDARMEIKVLYAMIPDQTQQGDGFGVSFAWDTPLLDGYSYEVLDNVARHPSVVQFDGCDTPGIYRVLKRDRPDAVLVNGWVVKTCLQTVWACRRLGLPCLVRGEANLLRPRARWKHALHRLLLSQYSAYLYIGVANAAFYRFHGCPEGKMFFAPYCVDHDFFAREAVRLNPDRDKIRLSLGLTPATCVFLFVGKLEPKKKLMDVLEAMRRMPEEHRRQAHLLVVGEGSERSEAETFVREHQVPATFTGFRNQRQLPELYAASDVLVLPSDAGETWGLVVNEAMASGRPAIVSRSVGCYPDLMIEERTGSSFGCGDVDGLAHILSNYITRPAAAAQQGKHAAAHIEQYSFRVVADGLEHAVKACVKPAKRS